MMRAVLILAGIGTLVAMELGTPPRAKTVTPPLTQATVGGGDSRDSLAKPDRLEIPYFQNELPAQPIAFVERMPPADATPVISKDASKIVSENRHDAKTKKVVGPKPRPKIPDSKPRPKITDSNTVANTRRSKASMDAKPCRPNAFDSFLKALKLSSRTRNAT